MQTQANAPAAATLASKQQALTAPASPQVPNANGLLAPNPWLALLPPGAKPDYAYWNAQSRVQWASRAYARQQRRASAALVATTESEPNDTQASADGVANFGTAADPAAVLTGSLTASDVDFYSFTLRAGDVISAAVPGGRTLELHRPDGTVLVRTQNDPSSIYPAESPLPGNRTTAGGAAFAYVVNTAGTYALAVSGPTGSYQLELEAYRPRLDQGGVQTLFVDFDGAVVDPAIFGGPAGARALTPLRDFLPAFGLTAAQESTLIDAILAEARESLSADLVSRGLNPKFALDLRNSRDHVDPSSDAQVSRVVVGGTMQQLGFETIGIAQSIDPGNFAGKETAVVLLDYLSGAQGLANITLAPGSDRLALVARAIGNIVAHEAGHYLGDFHTTNENAQTNIMDEGGNLPNTLGLGADGVFGTSDDADVDFGLDTYSLWEGFEGAEDTLNTVAFATSGQTALGRLTVRPEAICAGRLRIELRDTNLSGAASVSITSSAGDRETLTLQGSSGVYTGGIDTVQGTAVQLNGKLEVQNLATLRIAYQDANDGTGAAKSISAQVSIDCQAATISNLLGRDDGDIAALVSFATSEPTLATVRYGTSCASATQSASSDLNTSHRVSLSSLTANTTYYYAVTVTDAVGNVARADNSGACYTLRTAAKTSVFKRTFETGLEGFVVAGGGSNHGFHVTTGCAATLAGHSLPNALWFGSSTSCSYFSETARRGTATSPAIAVDGNKVTKLRFNYLLDAAEFDYVQVYLSVDGKPFQTVANAHTNIAAPALPTTGRAYRTYTVELNPYLPAATASAVVRFEFFTDAFEETGLAGLYVDDVEVLTLAAGTECTTSAQCDDGVFCNGAEACVTGRCVKGPSCNDGIDCSLDRCNEAEKKCSNAPLASFCQDEAFCDGANICSPTAGCIALGNPCAGETDLVCNEDRKYCTPPCESSYFLDGFESDYLQFETTGASALSTAAGDHPGATGTRGFEILNAGTITSNQIFANRPGSSLRLAYWMEVNAYDLGESVRVQYCASECENAARWITLNTVGGTRAWRAYEHTLPAGANTDTLQLRWVTNASGSNEYTHVDDVVVRNASCSEPLPAFNPSPPTISASVVRIDSTTGLVTISGTAADPDDDVAYIDVVLTGPDIYPFTIQKAAGTSSWIAQWYLQPGPYSGTSRVTDRNSLTAQDAGFTFVVPERTPPPAPLFSANFEQGNLSQFTTQGAVSVITAAGDRPGTTGTRGVQVDDSGRIVTLAINASAASGTLQLQYWLDVNNFDTGESAKVAYCVANCTVEANWIVLNSVGGTTGWRSYTHALPASAKTSALQLRWLSNANGLLEYIHVDDIVLGVN